MVRYKFFVHLDGLSDGGFEDISYSVNADEAKKTIEWLNEEYRKYGKNCRLSLISIEEIQCPKFIESSTLEEHIGNSYGYESVDILHEIHTFPKVDVAPIKHAKWECVNESENVWMRTGENGCGNEIILLEGTPNENEWYYCPHCGAKMDVR